MRSQLKARFVTAQKEVRQVVGRGQTTWSWKATLKTLIAS